MAHTNTHCWHLFPFAAQSVTHPFSHPHTLQSQPRSILLQLRWSPSAGFWCQTSFRNGSAGQRRNTLKSWLPIGGWQWGTNGHTLYLVIVETWLGDQILIHSNFQYAYVTLFIHHADSTWDNYLCLLTMKEMFNKWCKSLNYPYFQWPTISWHVNRLYYSCIS